MQVARVASNAKIALMPAPVPNNFLPLIAAQLAIPNPHCILRSQVTLTSLSETRTQKHVISPRAASQPPAVTFRHLLSDEQSEPKPSGLVVTNDE